MILFCVLPFGVERDENAEAANDKGAPKKANLKKKFIITSIISFFVTGLIVFVSDYFLHN
jgi:predicted secreted protein